MLARILAIGMGVALAQGAMAQTTGSVHGGGTRTSPFGAGGNAGGAAQPPAEGQTGGQTAGQGSGEQAPIITGEDPQLIANLLQDWGYKARLSNDDQGNPQIDSAISGINYQIYFYGCTNGQACNAVQFSAGFNLDQGLGMDVVNDWHNKKRYTHVYLDENNDPWLAMDINLYGGGITTATLQDYVYLWESLVNDFKVQINW